MRLESGAILGRIMAERHFHAEAQAEERQVHLNASFQAGINLRRPRRIRGANSSGCAATLPARRWLRAVRRGGEDHRQHRRPAGHQTVTINQSIRLPRLLSLLLNSQNPEVRSEPGCLFFLSLCIDTARFSLFATYIPQAALSAILVQEDELSVAREVSFLPASALPFRTPSPVVQNPSRTLRLPSVDLSLFPPPWVEPQSRVIH
jgi:hypothetical protein